MAELRDTIEDQRLRRLLDSWESRRGGRRMPARADIDPADIGFVLGYIMMVDVHHDPLRFYFRLIGTRTPRRHGIDFTGYFADELPLPEVSAAIQASYTEAVEARAPSRVLRDQVHDGVRVNWEVLRLPLSNDGECVDGLMIGVIGRPR